MAVTLTWPKITHKELQNLLLCLTKPGRKQNILFAKLNILSSIFKKYSLNLMQTFVKPCREKLCLKVSQTLCSLHSCAHSDENIVKLWKSQPQHFSFSDFEKDGSVIYSSAWQRSHSYHYATSLNHN